MRDVMRNGVGTGVDPVVVIVRLAACVATSVICSMRQCLKQRLVLVSSGLSYYMNIGCSTIMCNPLTSCCH